MGMEVQDTCAIEPTRTLFTPVSVLLAESFLRQVRAQMKVSNDRLRVNMWHLYFPLGGMPSISLCHTCVRDPYTCPAFASQLLFKYMQVCVHALLCGTAMSFPPHILRSINLVQKGGKSPYHR